MYAIIVTITRTGAESELTRYATEAEAVEALDQVTRYLSARVEQVS